MQIYERTILCRNIQCFTNNTLKITSNKWHKKIDNVTNLIANRYSVLHIIMVNKTKNIVNITVGTVKWARICIVKIY